MEKIADKVSKLKPFLSSCLALIKDKESIAKMEALIKTLPEGDLSPKRLRVSRPSSRQDMNLG